MGCCGNSRSKTRRWSWIILLAVVVIVILVAVLSDARGQTPNDGAVATVTNQTCPVMTDEPVDPQQWIEYQGERVYFCCRMCKRKFERHPEVYLANLPQFAIAETDTASPDESHGHTDDHTDGPSEATNGPSHGHGETEPDHAPASDGHGHDGPSAGVDSHEDEGHGHAASSDALSHGEEAEHDHAAHDRSGSQTGLAKIIGWLGNFHPPSVNFPIALLLSGAMAELLLMFTGRSFFDAAARFCIWLGTLSTVPAVILGWFFAGFRLSDPDWIMTVHRWLGTATGVWAIMLLLLCIAAHRTNGQGRRWLPWYRLALFVGALAVAANGFFGGAMIYGLDHYAW